MMTEDLTSELIEIDNKLADVTRLKELEPRLAKVYEDPSYDLQGEERVWNNWVVETYMPYKGLILKDCDQFNLLRTGPNQPSEVEKDEDDLGNAKVIWLIEDLQEKNALFKDIEFLP